MLQGSSPAHLELSTDTQAKDAQARFLAQLANDCDSDNLVIPSFPDVTLRIRNLADDANTSVQQLAAALAVEPVLAAQVLRLANSALYRQSGPAETSLDRAIQRVGMAGVRDMAVMFGMRQLALSPVVSAYRDYLREVWEHSLLVAFMARSLGLRAKMANLGSVQLAGLLHDLGKFYVIARASDFPDLFGSKDRVQRIAAEWHGAIGRALLESWALSPALQEVAEEHELLDRDPNRLLPDLADVVGVANAIADLPEGEEHSLLVTVAVKRLNISAEMMMTARAEAVAEAEVARGAFPAFGNPRH